MSLTRSIHVRPHSLRWRLVSGFVLSAIGLQVILTVSERFVVQRALQQPIQVSLEGAIKTVVGDALVFQHKALMGSADPRVVAMQNTLQLPGLTARVALPDQPALLLDQQGRLLAQTATLAGDRARAHPLGPGVSRALAAAVRPRLGETQWTGQISTPDGPYLAVVQTTPVRILTVPVQKSQVRDVIVSAKMSGKKADSAALTKLLGTGHTSRLVILVAHRLGDTEQTVQTVTTISLIGMLTVIGLSVLLSLLVVGRSLRPLAGITHGAERLAAGDYDHRVTVPPAADEVGRLGVAFNRMATAISAAFAAQRRFVADASHELRTPLTALRGYVDVLLLGAADERATRMRVLSSMQDDLARMSRLVNDLLMLARFDADPTLFTAPIEPAQLLRAAVDEGGAIAQGTRHITLGPVPGDLEIRGDWDRLRQVLSNLIQNACTYCPPGSRIEVGAHRDGPYLVIVVRDNGPGIAPADLARLGERFYRGDAARSRGSGGTGLGLAIARAIVEAHGGSMSVESELGSGTCVFLRLPATEMTDGQAGERPSVHRPAV